MGSSHALDHGDGCTATPRRRSGSASCPARPPLRAWRQAQGPSGKDPPAAKQLHNCIQRSRPAGSAGTTPHTPSDCRLPPTPPPLGSTVLPTRFNWGGALTRPPATNPPAPPTPPPHTHSPTHPPPIQSPACTPGPGQGQGQGSAPPHPTWNSFALFFGTMPASVMMPSMSVQGATSKAGFHTPTPAAATRVVPRKWVICAWRPRQRAGRRRGRVRWVRCFGGAAWAAGVLDMQGMAGGGACAGDLPGAVLPCALLMLCCW